MSSIALITRDGLDGVIDVPKKQKVRQLSESSAYKAARLIYIFKTGKYVNANTINSTIKQIAERLKLGITEEGARFAHAFEMLGIRARFQAGGDYLLIKTSLSSKKLRSIHNPYEAAIEAITSANMIYHGNKNEIFKWLKRMEFEKEIGQ